MNPQALKDIHIWITRPKGQSDSLCASIQELGGLAIRLPTVEIQPPDLESAEIARLAGLVGACTQAVFVSYNAVHWAFRLLPENVLETLRARPTFAPGAITAAALRASGCTAVHTATSEGSEALLSLPELEKKYIGGEKIVIFHARGGRELLGKTLEDRGAKMEYVEIYRRVRPQYEPAAIGKLYEDTRPDLILVSSRTSLRNLHELFPKPLLPQLQETQLLALSRRIATLAEPLGFRKAPIVTADTGEQSILCASLRYAAAKKETTPR